MSVSGSAVTLLGVARNLGMRRARLLLIASVFATVSLYSLLLSASAAGGPPLVVPLAVFLSSFAPTAFSVFDTISTNRGSEVFRLLGAREGVVARAFLLSVSASGLAGILSGLLISLALSYSTHMLQPSIPGIFVVLLSSCSGMVAGVAAGVRSSWKTSS
jgi:hypothetical protein